MSLKFKLIGTNKASLACHGDAFDLPCRKIEVKGNRIVVSTGVAIAAPFGSLLLARSSVPRKYDMQLCQGVGLIDSNYREEIIGEFFYHGRFYNDSDQRLSIYQMADYLNLLNNQEEGIRLLQLYPTPRGVKSFSVEYVNSLDDTDRTGGFGSSGN